MPRLRVKTYPVSVEGDDVVVEYEEFESVKFGD